MCQFKHLQPHLLIQWEWVLKIVTIMELDLEEEVLLLPRLLLMAVQTSWPIKVLYIRVAHEAAHQEAFLEVVAEVLLCKELAPMAAMPIQVELVQRHPMLRPTLVLAVVEEELVIPQAEQVVMVALVIYT